MTTVAAGIIVTISSIIIIIIPASMIGGKIADKFGRKKSYMYAQFLSAAFLVPCAMTKNAHITIVCLLVSTFFNGFIRPAFRSMMTDILPPKQRQAGFSLQYLCINVGVAIGFGMISFISGFSLFVLSTVIWTAGEIISSISSGVYISNNSPNNYRARLIAISSVGWAIGASVSTSLSGAYIQIHGYKSIWILTFFIALISALLMFVVKIFSVRVEKKKLTESTL